MAAIKMVYLGGGSSRAAGTMASFLEHGKEFAGSEVVLVDIDPDHLEVVRRIAQRIADVKGLDVTVSATTDRRAGLRDADAVLASFRPGDFAARALDERIPLKHGVIGQETQGPGGFFMALRSLHVFAGIVDDLHAVAPNAILFNYTNPVNIVSQAISRFTDVPIWSMCEGPIVFPEWVLRSAGLDPARADVTMAGVNHNCWSTEHTYDGADLMPLLDEAWQARRDDPTMDVHAKRLLHLAVTMRSVPADYFQLVAGMGAFMPLEDKLGSLNLPQGIDMTAGKAALTSDEGQPANPAELYGIPLDSFKGLSAFFDPTGMVLAFPTYAEDNWDNAVTAANWLFSKTELK